MSTTTATKISDLDKHTPGERIDLIGSIGRVYEYFLGQFESAEAVKDNGRAIINYGPVDGYAAFRMVHSNPPMTTEDLAIFLDEVERAGERLWVTNPT